MIWMIATLRIRCFIGLQVYAVALCTGVLVILAGSTIKSRQDDIVLLVKATSIYIARCIPGVLVLI